MFGGGHKKFRVKVTTGKAKGAGTNATINIKLIDHEGNVSESHVLDKWLHNDFEYGKIDFTLSMLKKLLVDANTSSCTETRLG